MRLKHRHIYIMVTPFFSLCKIGIAYDSKKRDNQVSKSTRKDMRVLVTLPFIFARFWEATLHTIFAWAHHPIRGNGGTEFFIGIITPLAIVAVLTLFLIENAIVIIAIGIMVVYFHK